MDKDRFLIQAIWIQKKYKEFWLESKLLNHMTTK